MSKQKKKHQIERNDRDNTVITIEALENNRVKITEANAISIDEIVLSRDEAIKTSIAINSVLENIDSWRLPTDEEMLSLYGKGDLEKAEIIFKRICDERMIEYSHASFKRDYNRLFSCIILAMLKFKELENGK